MHEYLFLFPLFSRHYPPTLMRLTDEQYQVKMRRLNQAEWNYDNMPDQDDDDSFLQTNKNVFYTDYPGLAKMVGL